MGWVVAACIVAPLTLRAQVPDASEDVIARDVTQQAAILADPASKPDQREQAAERLMKRQGRLDARDALLRALQDFKNRPAQTAVANAIVNDASPDPAFVDPLLELLRLKEFTAVAAQALSSYDRNPRVLAELIDFVRNLNMPPRLRVPVTRSLGAFVEKRAASTLVDRLADPNEALEVRNAACDALGDMTGIQRIGRDTQGWLTWWSIDSQLPDVQFARRQRDRREEDYHEIARKYQKLAENARVALKAAYDLTTDPAQRETLVLRWLRNPEPSIRVVGAAIVLDQKSYGVAKITQPVIDQLRSMIGDSSVDVRLQVTLALRAINDKAAVLPLLAQLAVETDPDVKVAIAGALGQAQLEDDETLTKVIDGLLLLLRDATARVGSAAAEALRDLGKRIRQSPSLSERVERGLRSALDDAQQKSGTGQLQGDLIEALAPLRDWRLVEPSLLLRLNWNAQNPPRVRIAVCKLISEIEWPAEGQPGAGAARDARDAAATRLAVIVQRDPEAGVRLASLQALKNCASIDQAAAIYSRLDSREERDQTVRDQAWDVLKEVFKGPTVSSERLFEWKDRFAKDYPNELARRFEVLKALCARLLKESTLAADRLERERKLEQLAVQQQNAGDLLMGLAHYDEAAPFFRAALDFWTSVRASQSTTAHVEEMLMQSLLRGGKYVEACKFAGERIAADPRNQEVMGRRIRDEVDRLRAANELKTALQLIELAKGVQPPLQGLYFDQLLLREKELRDKLGAAPPASP